MLFDQLHAFLCPLWATAIKSEQEAIIDEHTWVFHMKQNPDSSINKYKARLVAKGFTEVPGFDFKETYSPIIKFVAIRIFLAVALTYGWDQGYQTRVYVNL